MKGTIYNNRHDATPGDLNNTEATKAEAIRERSQDVVGTGVVRGLDVTLNTDLTFNIEPGVAYDANGERIDVLSRIDNLNLASLTAGVTNFIAIAYRDLQTTNRPNPITGTLSLSRTEASFNPKAVLVFDTTPVGSPPTTPRNLDEFGNPLVLLATIVPDSAGGGSVDNSVKTLVLTTTGNLEALQIQIDANKSDADTTKAEVVAARLDSDVPPVFHGSLFAHLAKFWSRFLGHENDTTNPHSVTLTQAEAAGGVITAAGIGPDVLNPSGPLPLYQKITDRTIRFDSGQIVINGSLRANASTLTLDFDTVGLNGIDVSPLGADIWYYIYALADDVGSVGWSLIASQSEVTPQAFPSGFSNPNFRLVGYALLDSSSDILNFIMDGSHWWFASRKSIATRNAINTTFTENLDDTGKRFCPQGTRHGFFSLSTTGLAGVSAFAVQIRPITANVHTTLGNGDDAGSHGSNFPWAANFNSPFDPASFPSPVIHWRTVAGSTLTNGLQLFMLGFTTHL